MVRGIVKLSKTATIQKPALLLVDHEFHRKTKSFDFLREILNRRFDVDHVYIDPEGSFDEALLRRDVEHVVIAQMDFITPLFLAAGKRVCVVQMYDGSSALPDDHWRLNKQARYINFSAALHIRALRLGAESLLVRYYPDPKRFSPVTDHSTARAFFWQRLPKSDINLSLINQLFGTSLDSLHVHTPADDGTKFDPKTLKDFRHKVTHSNWFETQQQFLGVLESCNIFIAPRYAEGIGHAFLEAMARGMVVLAYNLPTHSEYISNWRDGILFDLNSRDLQLTSDQRRKLGAAARMSVELGYQRWLANQDAINDFVMETSPALTPNLDSIGAGIDGIVASYRRGLSSYESTLRNNEALVNVFGSWRDLNEVIATPSGPQQVSAGSTRLTVFAGAALDDVQFEGWSDPEGSHRWALRRDASISVPIKEPRKLKSLSLDMQALRQTGLAIEINGRKMGEIKLSRSYERQQLDLERPVPLARGSTLRIRFKPTNLVPPPKVEARPLKFSLKAAQFEFI